MTPTIGQPPAVVDRVIVHQLDLARPAPGGIDTCIRGLLRHAPAATTFAVVGVDAGGAVPGRALGRWERHVLHGRDVWFMPVARLDAGDQRRVLPHAARLVAGLVRYRRRVPRSALVQAHRADVAWFASAVLHRPLAYMVHNQESGVTGTTSDSMWRRVPAIHTRMERGVVERAESVTVFNPEFAQALAAMTPKARFSPTWFEPALLKFHPVAQNPHRILWVGRVEQPKDPRLAVDTFARLAALDPAGDWSLDIVGTGTLSADVAAAVAQLPAGLRERVRLLGRLKPAGVADAMADSGVFLMTSHPGYEGFPRVLLEAMASGLPAVVTVGSDTGGVIDGGRTGFVSERDVDSLAGALRRAVALDRAAVRASVERFGAPQVVGRIFDVAAD